MKLTTHGAKFTDAEIDMLIDALTILSPDDEVSINRKLMMLHMLEAHRQVTRSMRIHKED